MRADGLENAEHLLRGSFAGADAIRDADPTVGMTRDQETRPRREACLHRGNPIQMSQRVLRHPTGPAKDPVQERFRRDAERLPALFAHQGYQLRIRA